MSRIPAIEKSQADPATASTLDAVKSKMGKIPNAIATIAQAPAALNGYLAFSDALSRGRLTRRQREVLALAIGQANGCQYCLSAHSLSGKAAGMSSADILNARSGKSENAIENAIASFAVKVVAQRGVISDEELAAARASGLDDGQIVAIIANVALNTLTNYMNRVAATDIDFPVVNVEL